MSVKPITFSVPMVWAILDGRKTQTRRHLDAWTDEPPAEVVDGAIEADDERDRPYRWPRTHAVGDRLWVREPWWTHQDADGLPPSALATHAPIYYQTDPKPAGAGRFRQARFMCRWMSRITLVVTDVRVQRLRNITSDDAIEEGSPGRNRQSLYPLVWFEDLWDAINGDGAWNRNPWVAAYTFRPIFANVDTVPLDVEAAP